MSGVGPHACTLARGRGISRPLRSHVGPYAGRKLVEKVGKVMMCRKRVRFIPISSSSHTLESTSLSSVFLTSQMEKAARSALRRIIILDPSRIF